MSHSPSHLGLSQRDSEPSLHQQTYGHHLPTSQKSQGLNVVCLISGGKDSLYSLLHCVQGEHRVVALGNLFPPSSSSPPSGWSGAWKGTRGGSGDESGSVGSGGVGKSVHKKHEVVKILPERWLKREQQIRDSRGRQHWVGQQHVTGKHGDDEFSRDGHSDSQRNGTSTTLESKTIDQRSSEMIQDSAEDEGDGEGEDLNSFMYQTVGHSVIPFYAEALGLPLYRRQISGRVRDRGRDYHYRKSQRYEGQGSESESAFDDQGRQMAIEHGGEGCGQEVEEEDETESLTHLLQAIIHDHPEVNAVSAGAILSTYQRTRIESVAVRLGLVPLAWLWMYPYLPPPSGFSSLSRLESGDEGSAGVKLQRPDSLTGLLDDMHEAGCHAVIIKVASGGLDEKVLGSDLADVRTSDKVLKEVKKFVGMGYGRGFDYRGRGEELMTPEMEREVRASVVGEGGEYESLAVQGPRAVWKGKIVFEDEISKVTSGGQATIRQQTVTGEGGVSYLRLGRAKVEFFDDQQHLNGNDLESAEPRNDDEKTVKHSSAQLVRIPGLFDPQFERIRVKLSQLKENPGANVTPDIHHQEETKEPMSTSREAHYTNHIWPPVEELANITLNSHQLTISNITCSGSTPSSIPASSQMQSISDTVKNLLDTLSKTHHISPPLTTSNVIFSLLLLESMSDFTAINTIYASMFPLNEPNPPARVTIACHDQPPGVKVSLNIILDLRPRTSRRALHVQSRSYWAPANIGPYSQAVCSRIEARGSEEDKANHDSQKGDEVEAVHLAGQIPLVPATMEPLVGTFEDQAILALQHLWRVAQERRVDAWPWGVAFLASESGTDFNMSTADRIAAASEIWRMAHIGIGPEGDDCEGEPLSRNHGRNDQDSDSASDSDGPDPWDVLHNRGYVNQTRQTEDHRGPGGLTRSSTEKAKEIGNHIRTLPNQAVYDHLADNNHRDQRLRHRNSSNRQLIIPPFVAAQVHSLPRQVSLEWWSLGLANLPKYPDARARLRQVNLRCSIGEGVCTFLLSSALDQKEQEEDEANPSTSGPFPKAQKKATSEDIITCFLTYYVSSEQWSSRNDDTSRKGIISDLKSTLATTATEAGSASKTSNSSTSSRSPADLTAKVNLHLVQGTAFLSHDICPPCEFQSFLNPDTLGSQKDVNTIPTETRFDGERDRRDHDGNDSVMTWANIAMVPCSSVHVTNFSPRQFENPASVTQDSKSSSQPSKTSQRGGQAGNIPRKVAFAMTLRIDLEIHND